MLRGFRVDWIKQNWITLVVVAVVLFVVWSTLGRRKPKAPGEGIQINVRCAKCGWKGIVSKYAQSCRKCGNKQLTEIK
jgi:hypothetical protein